MIIKRPSEQRGHADHGWLQSYHSFSFAEYYDPAEMGWGVLRVINEDRVQPGTGFGMHGHRDMEIITYILSGALEHRDSLGHGGIIERGEIQRMSAGQGIRHSERNPSSENATHLLQIWIEPAARAQPPSYEQQTVAPEALRAGFCLLASPDGAAGSAVIGQDARLYARLLAKNKQDRLSLKPGRAAYLQVVRGTLRMNGVEFSGGDGAKIANETQLDFHAREESEFLIFDLPPLP